MFLSLSHNVILIIVMLWNGKDGRNTLVGKAQATWMSEMEKIKETSLLWWNHRWLKALIGPQHKGVCYSRYTISRGFMKRLHAFVDISCFQYLCMETKGTLYKTMSGLRLKVLYTFKILGGWCAFWRRLKSMTYSEVISMRLHHK